jgi:hypothetical protein
MTKDKARKRGHPRIPASNRRAICSRASGDKTSRRAGRVDYWWPGYRRAGRAREWPLQLCSPHRVWQLSFRPDAAMGIPSDCPILYRDPPNPPHQPSMVCDNP